MPSKPSSPPACASTGHGLSAVELAADKLARRRKQCRVSQRRYRDKKNSAEYNLRLDVNALRGSVAHLKQTNALVRTRLRNDRLLKRASVRKAVEQYFDIFRHGLHEPEASEHARQSYDIQVNFLRAFMAPDVDVGGRRGIHEVLEQWWRYTNYHSALVLQFVSADVFGSDNEPIVKACGRLTVRMDRSTIEMIFPHICRHDALVELLIGCEVTYDTCTDFIFDDKLQVVQLTHSIDFLVGLGAVLPNALVVAQVLDGALISEQAYLGPSLQANESEPESESDRTDQQEGSEAMPSSPSSPLDLKYILC